MIRVLMFGWEFPPHISGGLGTACYGLTRSLGEMKVKVLFVIPKLYGDERNGHLKLIDASSVPGLKTRKTIQDKILASREKDSGVSQKDSQSKREETIKTINIPSALRPYSSPAEGGSLFASNHLTAWHYPFRQSSEGERTDGEQLFQNAKNMTLSDEEGHVFNFTGTYGANLMEEVYRYANVADSVAIKNSFDVIHAHDWMTFPAAIAAKKRSGKPLVIHVHSTEFDRSGNHISKTVSGIEKLGLEEADKIITVSNWTKQIVMSRYHVPKEKITVVHNGVIPKEQPEEFSFPDIGSHFVTFLGRVTHQKGPAFFVEAAEKVLQEFPEAHFIVAGAGDLLPQIIEKVAQLNMSSNFHFTGFLSGDQVDQIWALTDVYVMPSVSEPFGIAPLEAIQGGVPVILSKQSGVSEVMPHAIMIDFWDTRAVAAAICSVLRYESLSHVLRQNSQQHIKNLTWDKAAKDVKAVYHELTGKK